MKSLQALTGEGLGVGVMDKEQHIGPFWTTPDINKNRYHLGLRPE